ncbi:MAG TPA: hypothetical protein VLV54_15080, partial [Thermoanaerobaculia bacterium]|nr:hypothetical protein [Thermoanaerobaculia bacterium]
MHKTHGLLLASIFCFSIAILGLGTLHYYVHDVHAENWWFHLVVHTLSLIGAAGFVGFVFEYFLRNDLLHEFLAQMRGLFERDSEVAKLLSQEARKGRIKATLEAQLGNDIGNAIFEGVVERYFSRPPFFRKDFYYEATISELTDDIVINGRHPLTLKKDDYYRLIISQHYTRPFPDTETISIGCIWSEDFQELNLWFSKVNCLYREAVVLTQADQKAIIDCFQPIEAEQALEIVQKLLRIEYFRIDGDELTAESAQIQPSRKSAGIFFRVPERVGRVRPAAYEIQISGLACKSSRQHPVVLGE